MSGIVYTKKQKPIDWLRVVLNLETLYKVVTII